MRISRTTWITILIVVVSVVLASLLRKGAGADAPPAGESVVARARVSPLERLSLPGEVRAGGFLRARLDVTVSAERAGRLEALPVAEGGRVKEGQAVARLDDTIPRARLERARAAFREASLAPDIGAAALEEARSALRLAEHEQALHHPASPIDGIVEVHHVDEGEFVGPGTPLVDVVDADVLILDVDVDGELVGSVALGDRVAVRVTALGQAGRREGRVSRVASRADARTRRFRVEVSLEARATPLRAGMHAEARFSVPGGDPALYVRKAATRTVRGETGLFAIRGGKAVWCPVTVEEVYHRPDLWRVLSGDVAEGDQVVVGGFSGLRAGMRVELDR